MRLARRIGAITWRDVTSYSELVRADHPTMLWLYAPATLPRAEALLFDELASAEIRREHDRTHPVPSGIGIACLHDAIVSGSSLVGTSSMLYRLGPLAPLYVDDELSRDILSNDLPVGSRKLARRTRRTVAGTSVLLTHWNSAVYGHWLLENMPKLLLLRRIVAQLPSFRIVLPMSLPDWVRRWIELVLPDATQEIYDERRECLQCETLLMPTVLMHPEHFFHPELNLLLGELNANMPPAGPAESMLYVSRGTPSRYRSLSNQTEIERIAQQEGLTLVAPETLPIAQQIALFASARLIVGEFGSAMHNTLFSPPAAKVLCLNWINGMQSRIAQLRQQRVGYLRASDGTVLTYDDSSDRRAYHIDPRQFQTCLRHLL